jgi:hypothetical protein
LNYRITTFDWSGVAPLTSTARNLILKRARCSRHADHLDAQSPTGHAAQNGEQYPDKIAKFKNDDKARTIHSVDKVRNLDRRGAEEVYHVVSFRVQKGDGNWSDWTKWEESDTVKIEAHR